MKFTFILPTYNRPHYLDRCIGSMLAACLDDTTILIGDNSDNDQSRDIISQFASERIIYHKNEKNLGPDGNIHALFERVTSGYVFCMTDDAQVAPHALARVADVISSQPNIGLVSTPFLAQSEKNLKQFLDKQKVEARIYKNGEEALINLLPVCTSFARLVVKREAVDLDLYRRHIGKSLYAIQMLFGNALKTYDGIHIDDLLVKVAVHNAPTWHYPDDYGLVSSLSMITELCVDYPQAYDRLKQDILSDVPNILIHASQQSREVLIKTAKTIIQIPEVRAWPELDGVLSRYGFALKRPTPTGKTV